MAVSVLRGLFASSLTIWFLLCASATVISASNATIGEALIVIDDTGDLVITPPFGHALKLENFTAMSLLASSLSASLEQLSNASTLNQRQLSSALFTISSLEARITDLESRVKPCGFLVFR
jgi:hypothetical protein